MHYATCFRAIVGIGALLFISCQSPEPISHGASLKLSASLPRTSLPENATVVCYRAWGTGPAGAVLAPVVSSAGTFHFASLALGAWTLVIEGFAADETVVASSSAAIAVLPGENAVDMRMVPLDGRGTLVLTAFWPVGFGIDEVSGTITPEGGSDIPFSMAVTGLSATKTFPSLAAGSYLLVVNFREDGVPSAARKTEAVVLYKGQTTAGSLALQATDFNPRFSVTYQGNNANGGVLLDSASPYPLGASATALANTFQRPGWTFQNWNTKADGSGTPYAPGELFTVTEDIVLYARWRPVTDGQLSTGVAPLVVHFDATDVTAPSTKRPFHELEYRWDFGDTDVPWGQGINTATSSKNRATGPVTAHVYENPGTYVATLSIFDGTEATSRTYSVVVDDPNTAFSTKTTCVSSDGDFSGAPAGSNNVTSSNWNTTVSDALASGARRILFKRGQVFDATNGVVITSGDPILVGAFGTGANPKVRAMSSNMSIFHVGVTANLKLMDFDVDGQGRDTVRAMTVGAGGVLALRINAKDLGYLGSISGNNLAIVDCQVSNIVGTGGTMPIYIQDGFHVFIGGNRIDNNGGGEYSLRYQGGTNGVLVHNTMVHCGDHKAMMTIRGDYTQTTYISGKHVVSDNLFDGTHCVGIPTLCSIVPQNGGRNERIVDIILERNLFVATPGQMGHLMVTARDITIRNNLFNASGANTGPMLYTSWGNNSAGLPVPARIQIYNNTFFSNTSGGVTAVGILNEGQQVEDTVLKNNFLYAPNTIQGGEGNGGPRLVNDQGLRTVNSNNSTDWEARTASPNFVVPPGLQPSSWKLAPGAYGLGGGTLVPVWSDFFENPLTVSSVRNLGAIQ